MAWFSWKSKDFRDRSLQKETPQILSEKEHSNTTQQSESQPQQAPKPAAKTTETPAQPKYRSDEFEERSRSNNSRNYGNNEYKQRPHNPGLGGGMIGFKP